MNKQDKIEHERLVAELFFSSFRQQLLNPNSSDSKRIVEADGSIRYVNSKGQLHRTDGPAEEYANGSKEWYLYGQYHREDGPAVEFADGTKKWLLNGQYHREAGPAIECADGTKKWLLNGQRHREDGPAIEWADGRKFWYLNGVELTEKEFNKQRSQQ